MAYAHMFYGDFRKGDKPRTFLRQFEEDLAELPHLSETEKCHRFYNYCRSGYDAEYWYEELERNSPKVLTSWFTLANHFRVKWLNASPNILLEIPKTKPVIIAEPDTATTFSHETTTTTTTAIPAPVNTAAPAVYETTTTPEPVARIAGARHVIATSAVPQTQPELELMTTTAISNTAIENDNGELAVGRAEEQEKMIERNGVQRREAREESNTGEQEVIQQSQGELQDLAASPIDGTAVDPESHEPVRFDRATDIDESPSPVPTFVNTNPDRSTPKPAPRLPENPVPRDVPVDPVRTKSAYEVPRSPTAIQLIQSTHPPSQLVRAPPKRTVTSSTGDEAPHACTPATGVPSSHNPAASVPISPVPVDPDPGELAADLANTATTQIDDEKRQTTASQLDRAPPKPTVTQNGDVVPCACTPATSAPSNRTPAASVPINSVPVDPDPSDMAIDPEPINPSPVTTDNCTSAAHTLVNCTHVTFAYPMPDDYVPTDPNHVRVSPIHITPAEPVHIDPVAYPSITSAIKRALTSITWTSILLGFIFLFFILE